MLPSDELYRAVAEIIVFLDTASEDIVELDAAVQQLEGFGWWLQQMDQRTLQRFRAVVEEMQAAEMQLAPESSRVKALEALIENISSNSGSSNHIIYQALISLFVFLQTAPSEVLSPDVAAREREALLVRIRRADEGTRRLLKEAAIRSIAIEPSSNRSWTEAVGVLVSNL